MTGIQAITFLLLGLVALVTEQTQVSYVLLGLSVLCGIINDICMNIRKGGKTEDDSEAM